MSLSDFSFDMSDLGGLPPAAEPVVETVVDEPMGELNAWAEEQLSRGPRQAGKQSTVFFDIETGPRPLDEIECFYDSPAYQPPLPLPPWDDSMAKYGNVKKEELRKQKRDEQLLITHVYQQSFFFRCLVG